ncbi:MAG TPA: sigma-70 family RNA polymerase sigma factor [Burkholderiales bacterium]|nr:sigma-70 family RNA polymerase sigma factor [Burkholderiales bacterium]
MSADAATEEAMLIEGIARGREQDLAEFYRRYHGRIYAFLLRRLGDAADAAEAANDVMLEVWRGAARFEGRSRPLTWVLGIAQHKALDRMRRRRPDAANDERDPQELEDAGAGAPELLGRKQDSERLRRCLERLSEVQRAVVHLAFFEDLGYDEIAAILECPQGTVKTRMFHAKQGLKRCLGEAA